MSSKFFKMIGKVKLAGVQLPIIIAVVSGIAMIAQLGAASVTRKVIIANFGRSAFSLG